MRTRSWILAVVSVLGAGIVFVSFWTQRLPFEETRDVTVSDAGIVEDPNAELPDGMKPITADSGLHDAPQLVEQDWISFQVPRVVEDSGVTIDMKILQELDQIDVNWTHPATGNMDAHTLQSFSPGDTVASYHAQSSYGNFLPGDNVFEILGYRPLKEGDAEDRTLADREKFRFRVTISFDLQDMMGVSTEDIVLSDLPELTDSDAVVLNGDVPGGVEKLQVYSFNPNSGGATFGVLNRFSPGDVRFDYHAEEKLGNLLPGLNQYVVEAFDADGLLMARKHFSLRSTKWSLNDHVDRLFGAFTLVKGGWYVSAKKPWFSLRPVYETSFPDEPEGRIILPRPGLEYSSQSSLETPLCDFLNGMDYEKENYSYRAYSYEKCQQYRYGVTVYERFLDALRYEQLLIIQPTDYKDLSETVSSAFVMVETGGMPLTEGIISFEGMEESFSDTVSAADGEKTTPEWYYLYQMLLTESVPYPDKKIGDIEVEASEQRRADIVEIRDFLAEHKGNDLFTPILFPEEEK
ncbi:MAG: hypothetical protein Q8O95_03785 [bacterium]|nr:hypothetical protein [bacterium]